MPQVSQGSATHKHFPSLCVPHGGCGPVGRPSKDGGPQGSPQSQRQPGMLRAPGLEVSTSVLGQLQPSAGLGHTRRNSESVTAQKV